MDTFEKMARGLCEELGLQPYEAYPSEFEFQKIWHVGVGRQHATLAEDGVLLMCYGRLVGTVLYEDPDFIGRLRGWFRKRVV